MRTETGLLLTDAAVSATTVCAHEPFFEPSNWPTLPPCCPRGLLSRLLAMERHRQVRPDDGRDVPRPHHGSVTAEIDDFALDADEVVGSARVAACPNLQAVIPPLQWSLEPVTSLDCGDDPAVQCDLERSTSELYPDTFSGQSERS